MYISLPDNRIVTHIEGGEIIEQSDNLVAVAIAAGTAQASLTVE
jgi:molybdate-binding protein